MQLNYVYDVCMYKYRKSTGKLYSGGCNRNQLKTITVPFLKSSVDSGRFIPGIFRINPYQVESGNATLDEMASLSITTEDSLYTYVASWTGVSPLVYGVIAGTQRAVPLNDGIKQITLQKAYAKIRSADLGLGESIGELRETIDGLRNPLKSLKKFLVDNKMRNLTLLKALATKDKGTIRKLGGSTAKASADAASNTWLELRYGLRPLVMLVQDVIEKVNEKARAVWDPELIRTVHTHKILKSTYRVNNVWDVSSKATISCNTVVEDRIGYHCSVQYRQANAQSFLDQLGLTPRFLPETAWELTRLSFVVDWIFTIGPWLSTLRIAPDVTILGNTVGTRVERRITTDNFQWKVYNAGHYVPVALQPGECSIDTYKREVKVDLSLMPHFTWGNTMDLFKTIDAASLIWNFLPGRRTK